VVTPWQGRPVVDIDPDVVCSHGGRAATADVETTELKMIAPSSADDRAAGGSPGPPRAQGEVPPGLL
jgi:hypothetical protein